MNIFFLFTNEIGYSGL